MTVRQDSTKFMLTVPDSLTKWEIIYLQFYFQNWCLMFDLLLFMQFVGNMLFCIITYMWFFWSIFWYLSQNFENTIPFLHKTADDCVFLCQQTCVYVTITASICFENWFSIYSKILNTMVNISIPAKNNFFSL